VSFLAKLIRRDASRIGLNREIHQIKHHSIVLAILAMTVGSTIQRHVAWQDFGFRDCHPLFGSGDAGFHFTHRGKVFVQLLLIPITEPTIDRIGLLEYDIANTLVLFDSTLFFATGDAAVVGEKTIEDQAWIFFGWDGDSLPTEDSVWECPGWPYPPGVDNMSDGIRVVRPTDSAAT
jgi:hypothetical protein